MVDIIERMELLSHRPLSLNYLSDTCVTSGLPQNLYEPLYSSSESDGAVVSTF